MNTTSSLILVSARERIGHLLEFDYTNYCAVISDSAEISRSEFKLADHEELRHAQYENFMPNGVTIYGDTSMANKFADIVNEYDIWSSKTNTGIVNIHRHRWM